MLPLMVIDEVIRIPGKPLVVLGKLSGGPVTVGQALVLRRGGAELAAEISSVSLGFDKLPPQRAEVGDNVVLGLRGGSLEQIEGGWLIFAAAEQR